MSQFIQNQNWRYSTKRFDATRKLSADDLDMLKEAIRLSTSSYGLQPYKVLIIEDPELREKLKPAAPGNHSQITDASQLFVFANVTNLGDAEIDSYISNIVETRGVTLESIIGYGTFMKSTFSKWTLEKRDNWTTRQAYLALGNLINAAAEHKIDVSPMEGFDAEAFDEILGLKAKGLHACVIAAIGYRHEEDGTQHLKKVRKSQEELFIHL